VRNFQDVIFIDDADLCDQLTVWLIEVNGHRPNARGGAFSSLVEAIPDDELNAINTRRCDSTSHAGVS
jgi:hypothetical protein